MTIYQCERCHYSTDRKTDMMLHLQRKKKCIAEFSDIDSEILLDRLLEKKAFCCDKCPKSFTLSRTLARHKKYKHPEHVSTENTSISRNNCHNNNPVSSSHNPVSSPHNSSVSSSYNNTTNTTNIDSHDTYNINIHLNLFGQEQLEYLLQDETFLLECLRKVGSTGVPDIVKKIWCNKETPENSNVQLKREYKPKLVKVFMKENENESPKWVVKQATEIVDKMIEKGTGILVCHNNKLYYDISSSGDNNESDDERYDLRSSHLADIRTKKRGTGKVKDAVILNLREFKKDLARPPDGDVPEQNDLP
jgi:hypothetical protein